ncbi:MAG: AI-2E family transporter [Chlorobium sp.]|jgi:predicted PurR-regulated permease PerM|uniref:AI-2E family transporter n=1 Tax=Chlorobium sp. TaxID=1095 RepID=UPI001D503742|nr:AI-2E family transporter [Chlorobium sp.]MBN1278462.1 AI-2E family transporter [Chlorobiaceae bacterium]MCF8215455.1 AI-2E family transporter [Chlorobium sp.]MCF8270320.1 AI-2E family transporter [Chlorobium sp.]MCF8286662.1 AI-2E family transporter [Chlorobium sp.]MCF8290355.1 AI-2E family transporter [Chlorobium sp.]
MNTLTASRMVLIMIVLAISALFFAMIRYFFMAIFLAAIFSALSMPIYSRIDRLFRGYGNLSSAFTMILLFIMVFLPFMALASVVAVQAYSISSTAVPWIQAQLREPTAYSAMLNSWPYYQEIEPYREDILKKAAELAGQAGGFLFNSISALTVSAVNDLFLLFVFLYTMFFFLKDGKPLLDKVMYYIPLAESDQNRLLERFLSVTRATLKGTMVVGLIQGSFAGLALHLAGIPSALFWGTIMSVLSVVPVLGPPLVWFPASVYLAISGHYTEAAAVFLFCSLVVSQLDNILRPILIGRDTRMHELLIFFGTLGGLGLFGLFGFIIGPIIAALFITVWELYGEAFSVYLREIKEEKQLEP